MIFNQKVKLNNGIEMPILGFGTWLLENDKAPETVNTAIKVGYRHIDTAEAYGNEKGVGEAVRSCGIPREQIFITSKVAAEIKDYEGAKKAIQQSLDDLNIGYIDLMLIHCPQPWQEFRTEKHYEKENVAVWKALEEFYNAGKLKAIGVSNFQIGDLENLLANCTVKPMVNQVLAHITNTPFETIKFCQSHEIVVEAHSPFGHGEILNNPFLNDMAKSYKVSVTQLCLRYLIQLNISPLPKTLNPEHMKSNADIDFVISEKDMETLKNAEHIKSYGKSNIYYSKYIDNHN